METKHTSGQWHKRNGDTENHFEIIGDFATNKTIALLPLRAFVPEEEAEANAKLIAAAPELLDMLIRISKIEDHAFTLKSFDVKRLKSEVNEAISKATE